MGKKREERKGIIQGALSFILALSLVCGEVMPVQAAANGSEITAPQLGKELNEPESAANHLEEEANGLERAANEPKRDGISASAGNAQAENRAGVSVQVTFQGNGGEPEAATQTVVSLEPYGELPVPKRDGCYFVGWFTQEQGGEMVSASTLVGSEEEITLFAHWSSERVYHGTMGGNQWEYAMDPQTGLLAVSGHGALLPEGAFPKILEMMDAEGWKDQVTGLVIGSGITSFQNQNGATQIKFQDFPNLKEVCLPDSLEDIKDVFDSCKSLEKVNLPRGLETIKTGAFRNTKLKRILVPGNVRTIMNQAFEGCADLEEVVLEEGVERIYPAFGGTAVKSLYLPASFRESVNMFQGSAIESIEISPENPYMQADGKAAYSKDGKKFQFVAPMAAGEYRLPDTVEELAEYAFFSSGFSKISIPASVREIPFDCFGSPALEEVELAEGVEKIASGAFSPYCSGLKEVSIPASVTEIGDEAFGKGVALGCSKDSAGHAYAMLFGHPFYLRDTLSGLLRFDPCGGNVSQAERPITQESCFCFLPVPVRENYVFQGWYTKETGGVLVTETSRYAGGQSQTLYARWEGEGRFLNFYGNGGKVLGGKPKYLHYGEPYGELPEAFREGYRLKGWYTEAEGGSRLMPEGLSLETGQRPEWLDYITIDIHAQWEPAETVKIQFDAQGGVLKAKEKFAVKGEAYGELPTPGREEYTFQGWYTKAEGGEEVTALSIADAPQTLYAHWKSIYPSYNVAFDANGGKVGTASKTVTFSKAYGALPKPERIGYQFEGWYTERAGGTQITEESLVSITEAQTLYAHWKANRYKVSFSANGGSVSAKEKEVAYGSAYGALPVPTREEYFFQGWYTKASGGTLVTADSIYQTQGNQTLYAQWEKRSMADYKIGNLSYAFGNSRSAFQYPVDYQIPKERYQAMFGNTQKAEAHFKASQKWGGSCFGMSTTSSLMLTLGNGIYPSSFRSGATKMSELKLGDKNGGIGMDVQEFIELMQISQLTEAVNKQKMARINDIGALCDAVKQVGKTGYPVIVLMWGASGGHAIIAYRYEDLGGGEGKIYVYDCNFPGKERFIYVKKLPSDVYAISYYINDADLVVQYSFCTYDAYYHCWTNRGSSVDDVLLNASSENMEIYSASGELMGKVVDGELETGREDVYALEWCGTTSDGEAIDSDTISISLPAGDSYTIKNTDPKEQELEVELAGESLSSEVVTDSSQVTFRLEEEAGENAVEVAGEEGEKYEITLKSLAELDKEEVCLSGYAEGKEEISLSQAEGQVDYKGKDAMLEVEGETYPDVAVDATASIGGKISDSGRKEFPYKSYVEYAITPDNGYVISDVLVDGVSVGAVSQYGFAELSYPHTIEAKFAKAQEEPAPSCQHSYKTAITKATLKKDGSKVVKCTKCGKVKGQSVIAKIGKVRVVNSKFTYTGKAIKAKLQVKDSKGKAIPSKYYTVSYQKNKQIGKATVKVVFKGQYKAAVSNNFYIYPKATKLTGVKAQSRGFVVKWKKQAAQTTGYQIQYSTSRSFKGKSVSLKYVVGASKTTAAYGKLKAKKKYYVRIRTYKKVGSAKYCSEWSKVKAVTVKK